MTKINLGAFIYSKADPSIKGMILPKPINGWTAVKLSMSTSPYKGEAVIGGLFTYNSQCWIVIPTDDYRTLISAGEAYLDWCENGCPVNDII